MGYWKWLVMALVTIWVAVWTLPDNHLHVIFCDVGQGDAILVTHRANQLLIDGGPGKRVMDCLERHMPFYDRRIEAVVMTHANSDHSRGLDYVKQRYNVLVDRPVLYRGQLLEVGEIKFEVLSPDSKILGWEGVSKENEQAIVGLLIWGGFDALLTSDASTVNYPEVGLGVEVIKVPHHGSKIGWDSDWWRKAKPQLAVISVGKNSYGHPTQEVIKTLSDLEITTMRTDRDGDIEVISDGERWWVK